MKLVPQKILAGFLNRNESAAFMPLLPNADAKKRYWTDVMAAQKARASLTPVPPSLPVLQDLPTGAQAHLDKVICSDAFQDNFGGFNWTFKLVQLDQLVPVQTFINVDRRVEPPAPSDFNGLLDYCLPSEVGVCTT